VSGVTVRFHGVLGRSCAPRTGGPRREATAPREMLTAAPRPTRAARNLALAYLIDRLIEEGKLRSYADAARVLGVTRARVTQILGPRYLPVAEQERILRVGR